MLHGWGMNSGVWKIVRPALESNYYLHLIDLPGYGDNSDIVAEDMESIVDLIIAKIPEGAHLMGWSLGGLITQAIAKKSDNEHSQKIKTLTLVASSPKFSQSDNWQYAITHEVLDNFSQNLQKDIEGTLKRFVALQFMGVKGAKALQKSLTDEILRTENYKTSKKGGGGLESSRNPHHEALNLGLEVLKHADYRKSTHSIPQHWILAGRDRLIPPEMINDLKLLRPDDQISLLENAGHAPFMTHPKEFTASVLSFLQKHA